jgi:hypothetical protein
LQLGLGCVPLHAGIGQHDRSWFIERTRRR